MKFLHKYHKQDFSQETVKRYQVLAKMYQLPFKAETHYGLFQLAIFATGLQAKTQIETSYEAVRNEHIDLWDHLLNTERKPLLDLELDPIRTELKQFKFRNHTIIIPFFDTLLNDLYFKETTILELPQFHKLYNDFKDQIVTADQYGFLPFQASMSCVEYVTSSGAVCVLYSEALRTLYRLEEDAVIAYPLQSCTRKDVIALTPIIIEQDDTRFLEYAYQASLLHPKALKKLRKKMSL